MSSEEDYYYRRHDRRNEDYSRFWKRNPGRTRRRRYENEDHYDAKSRRTRKSYGQNSGKWIAVLVFLFLLGYEMFILKGPLNIGRSEESPQTPTRDHSGLQSETNRMSNTHVHAINSEEELHNKGMEKTYMSSSGTQLQDVEDSSSNMRDEKSLLDSNSHMKEFRSISNGKSSDQLTDKTTNRQRIKSRNSAIRLTSKPADIGDIEDNVKASLSESKSKKVSTDQTYHRGSSKLRKGTRKAADDINSNTIDGKRNKFVKQKQGSGGDDSFWQWFQEIKGSEKNGVTDSIKCLDDNVRLCQMFYKYLRKYKIRTVFDVSCATNIGWMPEVVNKAGNELWGFKYYCSLPFEADREMVKAKLTNSKFVEFSLSEWWQEGYPDEIELLFAWDTLPHISYGRVWNFFVQARRQNVKFILVDNYPGILNDPVSNYTILVLKRIFYYCL